MGVGVLLACGAVRAIAADPAAVAVAQQVRPPFVIGAPGRLDAAGDRRHPRRYLRDDSAIGAYADIEEVEDPTWLRHEIQSYVRQAIDCAGAGPPWCRREVRRIGSVRVISLAGGTHAEVVWLSGERLAVRLGWRRIVVTPAGSMTLDAPPQDFARALLAELPSEIEARELDADQAGWQANEVDRLLYYTDQVVAALPDVLPEEHQRHAARFVEENLARIAQLRAQRFGHTEIEALPLQYDVAATLASAALPRRLADQLAIAHAWRAAESAQPWCSGQLASAAAVNLAGWVP